MIYHVIGTMSGSSLDGLDIVYTEITDIAGQWTYITHASDCIPFDDALREKLRSFSEYTAREYVQLDADLGYWMGEKVAEFMSKNDLQHKIQFISSHGHTTFHDPESGYSAQIGHGAAIAQRCDRPVISELRMMDIAHGGQGAPIVPMAEKLLFPDTSLFLNLGGICNISIHQDENITAFDVTSCNRVLNLLANQEGMKYDDRGALARSGKKDENVLGALEKFEFFDRKGPKSLANEFGTEKLFPLLGNLSTADAANTFVHHIAQQIQRVVKDSKVRGENLLITGGGAKNEYLVEMIAQYLEPLEIEVSVPDEATVDYKEAVAMALLGVLRWREEFTVSNSYSGASSSSIGGAVWMT